MKTIVKAIIPLSVSVLILMSCYGFTSTQTASPEHVMETAISVAFTGVAKTQTALPTATISPTPAVVFPVLSRDNVSQISEIVRWQTDPSLQVIWGDNNDEIFIPELFDTVAVYDMKSFQHKQISLDEFKQLKPVLFTDEIAEQGNCSRFWVRQTNILSPDKTLLVTGWSYGHKQPQKTVVNIWNLIEKRCILQLPEYDGALTALAFSPNGNYLVFSTDRATYVWSVQKSEITCQVDYAWNAVIYPLYNDTVVLPNGWDASIWDIDKCERIQEYKLDVNNPVFSPNGELLAGIVMNRILISDARTGELLKTLEVQRNQFLDLFFSPDGRFVLLLDYGQVATQDNKNTFILWAVQP